MYGKEREGDWVGGGVICCIKLYNGYSVCNFEHLCLLLSTLLYCYFLHSLSYHRSLSPTATTMLWGYSWLLCLELSSTRTFSIRYLASTVPT